MKNVPYGISEVIISDIQCKAVKFGDGLTRIFSTFWGDEFGVQLIRSDKINETLKPFEANAEHDENWVHPNTVADESVYIVFDNEKSLDAMINQLQYVKDNFKSYQAD